MKFCTECQNMYYISIDETDTNQLNYYCRFCGHKDDQITTQDMQDRVVVLKTQLKKSEQKFNHMVNKYTKYDPTLPRKNNIKCPNEKCNVSSSEIIYLRYDDENMKYLYICENCDFTWKTDDNK